MSAGFFCFFHSCIYDVTIKIFISDVYLRFSETKINASPPIYAARTQIIGPCLIVLMIFLHSKGAG